MYHLKAFDCFLNSFVDTKLPRVFHRKTKGSLSFGKTQKLIKKRNCPNSLQTKSFWQTKIIVSQKKLCIFFKYWFSMSKGPRKKFFFGKLSEEWRYNNLLSK